MKEFLFAKVARYRGHCQYNEHFTEKTSMQVKWEAILEKMKERYLDFSIQKYDALQKQFKRFHEDALREIGITMEGANLSGLPTMPSQYHTLAIKLAEDIQRENDYKAQKASKAAKKKAVSKSLLTHEESVLCRQAIVNLEGDSSSDEDDANNAGVAENQANGAATLPVPTESVTSSITTSSSDKSTTKKRKVKSVTEVWAESLDKAIRGDEDQVSPNSKRRQLDLEERKVALEERKVELQEKELEVRKEEGTLLKQIVLKLVDKNIQL
jgi:hypothetical protein